MIFKSINIEVYQDTLKIATGIIVTTPKEDMSCYDRSNPNFICLEFIGDNSTFSSHSPNPKFIEKYNYHYSWYVAFYLDRNLPPKEYKQKYVEKIISILRRDFGNYTFVLRNIRFDEQKNLFSKIKI